MDKMLHELDNITINGKDIGIKWALMVTVLWVLHGNWSTSKQSLKILLHADPCRRNKSWINQS